MYLDIVSNSSYQAGRVTQPSLRPVLFAFGTLSAQRPNRYGFQLLEPFHAYAQEVGCTPHGVHEVTGMLTLPKTMLFLLISQAILQETGVAGPCRVWLQLASTVVKC